MSSNLYFQHSQIEPPAPVVGGLRWRSRSHDIIALCRGRGFVIADPDAPPEAEEQPSPEPGAALAPRLVSTPPPEARAGVEDIYQARAFDGIADGFTWSVAEGPPGMTIDRHSGKLSWTPMEGGYVDVSLCARSVYGAMTNQRWTVCVRKAVAARPFAPNPRIQAALRRKQARKNRIRPLPTRSHSVWRTPVKQPGTPLRPTGAGPPSTRLRAALPLRV